MDELTLFGKAMERIEQHRDSWWYAETDVAKVTVARWDSGVCTWWATSDRLRFDGLPRGNFATPELARDDAEATLRRIRDALTEVIGDD